MVTACTKSIAGFSFGSSLVRRVRINRRVGGFVFGGIGWRVDGRALGVVRVSRMFWLFLFVGVFVVCHVR